VHDHAQHRAESETTTAGRGPQTRSPLGSHAAELLRLQRTAGNAAVSDLLQPAVQRTVSIDEVDTQVDTAPAAASPAAGGGVEGITSEGGVISVDGVVVNISGAIVNLKSPVVRTDGILQTDTLIANNVVGANYTPGAGNVM
jgi:hypothetical protein